jgi:hypothetical protein
VPGATNAKIKSYRDVLCPAGGNPATVSPAPTRNLLPESSLSSGEFITVRRKTREIPSAVNCVFRISTRLNRLQLYHLLYFKYLLNE